MEGMAELKLSMLAHASIGMRIQAALSLPAA